MPHKETSLAALLALLVERGEGIPIHVRITPSDELERLRRENEALQADVAYWKNKLQTCEQMLANEMAISERLANELRKHDIKIPKNLYRFR